MPRAIYHWFWGKAKPEDPEDARFFHLLGYHCLDVVAVGATLWDQMERWRRGLSQGLNLTEASARRLVLFLLALHDLGKFSSHFQKMCPEVSQFLKKEPPKLDRPVSMRHDALGLYLFSERICRFLFDNPSLPLNRETMDAEDFADLLLPLATAVTGHHGRPPYLDKRRASIECCFPETDQLAAVAFVEQCLGLFKPDLSSWQYSDDLLASIQKTTYLLAGFTVLCDWLGSNQTFFKYKTDALELGDYYHRVALQRAREAIAATWLVPPRVQGKTGMTALFPKLTNPTDLQKKVMDLDLSGGPHLVIAEDLTGSGKTEAALTLAHSLMVETGAEGMVFGLPTMATADQMYGRVANAYDRMYHSGVKKPALVLAHRSRHLSKRFQANLGLEAPPPERGIAEAEPASHTCSAWLADNNKKALLGAVGVCTVDQIMLSVLRAKHGTLRLIGLQNKVLIIDEIHAYDSYMRRILGAVIQFHTSFGGSTILLSATLPLSMRRELIDAWHLAVHGDSQVDGDTERPDPYPLLTHVSRRNPVGRIIPLASPPHAEREIQIRVVTESCETLVAKTAARGQCLCWIRNTVDDCLETYRSLKATPGIDSHRIEVFHARFALGHRLEKQERLLSRFGKKGGPRERCGRIVIATQVVEQSLDLDFDRMISDLAPIDLLLQRLGRQQRHARDLLGRLLEHLQPDQRGPRIFTVYCPPFTEDPQKDWYKNTFARAQNVYPDTHHLWLTQKTLLKGAFRLPRDARALIESVYAADPEELPPGLLDCDLETYGLEMGSRSLADLIILQMARGYEDAARVDNEEQILTRMGLQSRTLRLMRWRDGCLVPLVDHEAWEMSQVSVPMYHLDGPASRGSATESALAALTETLPDRNRGVVPVVLEPEGSGWCGLVSKDGRDVALHYSEDEGLVLPKASQ